MASGPVPPATAAAMAAATGNAGEGAAEVADVVDGGHAVLAEGAGHRCGGVPVGDGLDRAAQRHGRR